MNELESKFAQTIKQNKSTIYTVCYMFSKDADEVNDLFQEAVINMWRGFEGFENRSNVKTWIYRVTLNTCISQDRKKCRSETEPLTMDITSCTLQPPPEKLSQAFQGAILMVLTGGLYSGQESLRR